MSWLPRLRRWGWAIRILHTTVIYDACVLYPAPLRDLLLELAAMGIFHACWTDEIHEEWIRNVTRNRPDLDPRRLQRTRELMDASVMDSLVTGYQGLVTTLDLPDANDRHVLAAAIHCGANAIITFNLNDFPSSIIGVYDIEANHPDEFLHQQFERDPAGVVNAARQCRARLKSPPKTGLDYLINLEGQSLPKLVSDLRPCADLI